MAPKNSPDEIDEWELEPEDPIRFGSALSIWRQLRPWTVGMGGALTAIGLLSVLGSALDGIGVGLVILFLDELVGRGSAAETLVETLSLPNTVLPWLEQHVVWLALGVGLMFLAKVSVNIAHSIIASRTAQQLNQRLRILSFDRLLDRPHRIISRFGKARLITIFEQHLFSVTEALESLTGLISALLALTVLGLLAFVVSWQITLFALVAGLMQTSLLGRARRVTAGYSERSIEHNRALNAILVETLDALRTIRIFGQDARYKRRFADESERVKRIDGALEQQEAVVEPLTEISSLLLLLGCGAVAWACSVPAIAAITTIAILSRLQPYLGTVEAERLELARVEAPFRAVVELIGGDDGSDGTRELGSLGEGIRFERVSFQHGRDRPVLRDASFLVPQGRWTWLAGPSGAGKSTIVNLIADLYQPDRGVIRVGGVPLTELCRASLRSRMGFAGQDVELFGGSIADNIRWARPGADDAAVIAAARDADIHDFISAQRDGYATRVNDRALDLSGGQRQRLGLARALVAEPELLILDEATNAIGSASERRIMDALRRRFAGRTVLVISHHQPDVRPGDLILNVGEGKVEAAHS